MLLYHRSIRAHSHSTDTHSATLLRHPTNSSWDSSSRHPPSFDAGVLMACSGVGDWFDLDAVQCSHHAGALVAPSLCS
jgi:hypothetical protein